MKEMKLGHYSTEYMQYVVDEREKAKRNRIDAESDESERDFLFEG